jgi:hypothetical protein
MMTISLVSLSMSFFMTFRRSMSITDIQTYIWKFDFSKFVPSILPHDRLFTFTSSLSPNNSNYHHTNMLPFSCFLRLYNDEWFVLSPLHSPENARVVQL